MINTHNWIATASKKGSLGVFKAPSTAFDLGSGKNGLSAVTAAAGASTLERVLSVALGGFTLVAVIYFLFTLVIAAYTWLSAASDQGKVTKARDMMTNGLIGLLILVAVYAIAGVVGTMLGIKILEPGKLLLQLVPKTSS